MSSGPRTVVHVSIYGASAALKVGYMNENDGAMPLCHVGIFSGACSDCCCSLLIYLRTWRGMPLTKPLERYEGLFLDLVSTLFFGGGRLGSGELSEDNSSSAAVSLSTGRTSCLPLLCLTRGARWLLSRVFSP